MEKPILVLKFGTSTITDVHGLPDKVKIKCIADQVSQLSDAYRIVIVSSGAVGAGRSYISGYKGDINQRKAAAAIGNPILIGLYAAFFRVHQIAIAQSLCERHHFADRDQFLQLKATFSTLWDHKIIPIVNENDVVSNRELKFSDNDELAALIASSFGAEYLLICTSAGGLLDQDGKVMDKISDIDSAFSCIDDTAKGVGLGGMTSKLTFTKLATRMGIKTVIFGLSNDTSILDALSGKAGSHFEPQVSTHKARERWLGTAGMRVGSIIVDNGAAEALQNRKSLLAVGIRSCEGNFTPGEIIEIFNLEKQSIGVARCSKSSLEILENIGSHNYEVIHANDIVLL